FVYLVAAEVKSKFVIVSTMDLRVIGRRVERNLDRDPLAPLAPRMDRVLRHGICRGVGTSSAPVTERVVPGRGCARRSQYSSELPRTADIPGMTRRQRS